MTDGNKIIITDYLDGFQYEDQLLQFFPHSEGYVRVTTVGMGPTNPLYAFNYVYNYTDHLGNVRLSYAKDPQTGNLKVMEENNYYPFGLKHQNYGSAAASLDFQLQLDEWGVILAPVTSSHYKYKFQNQELQDELGLNWYSFKWRNYMPDIGRFFNVDPLSEKYAYQSHYNFSENKVTAYRELEGLESVYVMDQATNPNNKRVYTAQVYVVHDQKGGDGSVKGPYSGSSYPNNGNKHNTAGTGSHNYNNLSGHKGGTKKGLNLVDSNGNRNTPGTDPDGNAHTLSYVNVHSGVDPVNNNGLDNRGSEGCITIAPDVAGEFFENFDWNTSGNTNTGTSSGTIYIFRGGDEASSIEQQLQNGQNPNAPQSTVAEETTSTPIQYDHSPTVLDGGLRALQDRQVEQARYFENLLNKN